MAAHAETLRRPHHGSGSGVVATVLGATHDAIHWQVPAGVRQENQGDGGW